VTGSTASTTDDVGVESPGLRALELAVTLFTAVLTELVLVVSEGTVERREFTELVSFVIVLAFRYGCRLPGEIRTNETCQ
jgi:hypothetical protein